MDDKTKRLMNKLSDEVFEYGKNDCFTFTNALVKSFHGKDYLKLHAGYKSKKQADEYIKRFGGIEALTTGTLGYSVSPEKCIDGDVVIAEVSPGQVALGFVSNKNGLFKTKTRAINIPLKKCLRGWRIK